MFFPLVLAALTATLSYPPQGYELEKTFDSPKHTFRVECWSKGNHEETVSALCLWVVAPDGKAAEMLVSPDALTPLYSPEVRVSDDERWILWEEKLYHGANAHGLFERTAGVHFREIGPPIFSAQAWQFMSQRTDHPFKVADEGRHIIRVSEWPVPGTRTRHLALSGDDELTPVVTPNDHSLALSLYGDDGKTHVALWFCYYDLREHRFYLDDALKKHNRGLLTRSRQR